MPPSEYGMFLEQNKITEHSSPQNQFRKSILFRKVDLQVVKSDPYPFDIYDARDAQQSEMWKFILEKTK